MRVLLAAATLALGVSACGLSGTINCMPAVDGGASGDGGSATPTCTDFSGAFSDGGPVLAVTFSLNGAINFVGAGPYSAADAGNCQDLVGRFIQGGSAQTDAGAATVAIVTASTYLGPGSYAASAGSLYLGAVDGGASFTPDNIGSDTSVVVGSDLSGTITLTDWGDAQHDVENGTVTWTCAP